MVKLCDYGCGQEAKYPFKNGKWCCSESYNSCPKSIEKNKLSLNQPEVKTKMSEIQKELQNRPEVKEKRSKIQKEAMNRPEVKEKISKAIKEIWKDPKTKENYKSSIKEAMNRPEVKIKMSKIQKEVQNRPEVKVNKSEAAKEVMSRSGAKEKLSKIKTFTIDQIQEKYTTFAKEEEMRYGPDGKIQVHCKYSKCKNSKEKGGWFTPSKDQFFSRIYDLEKKDGNDGRYFYCPEGCKQKCCLYYFRSDPNLLTKFKKYTKKVHRETNQNAKVFYNKIKNIELRGKKFGYALDHKYSIHDGFINDVDPKIVGYYKNLECIPELENLKKNKNSSITLEELMDDIGRLYND